MGRRRTLDFEDEDEDEEQKESAAPAAAAGTAADTKKEEQELGTAADARKAVAAERTGANVSKQPKRKPTIPADEALGFEPKIVTDFEMPEKAKRRGKWSELAESLASGEAVVNLVNRQQATSLRQALKAKGKRATMAQLESGLFAVKLL